jgi:hypothetical protein
MKRLWLRPVINLNSFKEYKVSSYTLKYMRIRCGIKHSNIDLYKYIKMWDQAYKHETVYVANVGSGIQTWNCVSIKCGIRHTNMKLRTYQMWDQAYKHETEYVSNVRSGIQTWNCVRIKCEIRHSGEVGIPCRPSTSAIFFFLFKQTEYYVVRIIVR